MTRRLLVNHLGYEVMCETLVQLSEHSILVHLEYFILLGPLHSKVADSVKVLTFANTLSTG